MSIGIVSHEDCVLHEMGVGQLEAPERIKVISEALSKAKFASELKYYNAPIASKVELNRVHDADYILTLRTQGCLTVKNH